jgi:N utilization substance protein B
MTDTAAPKQKPKGSKNARRSMARLAAVQCVYQWLQSRQKADDILSYYHDFYQGMEIEGETLLTPDPDLFHDIVRGVQNRFTDLDQMISLHLKKEGQDIEYKKDFILLSVLYCGAYELMAHQQTDAPLIISDYLHVTKSFYEGKETKLINAVLDALKTVLRA